MRFTVFLFCAVFCYGRVISIDETMHKPSTVLSENIGNFSLEMLYHTGMLQPNGKNLIVSPITIWTAMAVLAEGASGNTRRQLNTALRLTRNKNITRSEYRNIVQMLQVNADSVELAILNAIIVDRNRLPLKDFLEDSKTFYQTETISLNFEDSENSANLLNKAISDLTHRKITNLVESNVFKNSYMLLTSGLYFKGQWTVSFNRTATTKQPFYDSSYKQIGEVDMMHNYHTYPFSNIKELQARVIELPYGNEERLSMIIILPNQGVSLETMFSNFRKLPLSTIFEKLRKFSDPIVDCNIPKFKIESDLDITAYLNRMGIYDLFDESKSRLPYMARTPLHVSKVIHKATIEVNEDGTTASGISVVAIPNRAGDVHFEANRPFMYMVVDNVVSCIIFGGFYRQPSL